MTLEEIKLLLIQKFGNNSILKEDTSALQPSLTVPAAQIDSICQELYTNEQTYFDYLACLTAIDNGPEKGTMEVVYNLYSIPYNVQLMLKIEVERNKAGEPLPQVPTVSHIWRTADWEGHPLRKDYQLQETYHGIKVAY